jgi:nucleoside-diphosphate-sugar epimerase
MAGPPPATSKGGGAAGARDIRDTELHSLCEGVDVLFNMAAQTSHMGGQKDPVADIAINAVAQVRLIGVMREVAPKAAVIHASTRQFYGRPRSLPVDELHPVNPPDANGVSKWAGEQYWLLEQRVHHRPVVSLRLTNCYGPRLRIRDARQTFLGIWIRRVLEDEPFEVWGGAQLRDLTYAEDVTDAFLIAAEKASEPALSGQVFNLGGSPADLAHGPRRAADRRQWRPGRVCHQGVPGRSRADRHRLLRRRRPGLPKRFGLGAQGRSR